MEDYEYHNEPVTEDDAPPSPVDDVRSRTMALLDFDTVRQRLADHTSFFPTRRLAFELSPSYLDYEVEELQKETAEGRVLLDEFGDVNLHSDVDTDQSVARAALGGILTGTELLEVSDTLEVHRRARNGVTRARAKAPTLVDMAEIIVDLDELRRQVRSRINDRGEVNDNATPSLRAIRNQMRRAYDRVTASLNRMIVSPTGQTALQDNVISIRGDRLVLQVKAEMRNRVPGIVHDASNTGATIFVEPFATVDLGNQWRELALEEEREVRRVLRDLSTLVAQLADTIRTNNEMTTKLDLILARARYATAIRGVSVLPKRARGDGDEKVRLVNGRHPILGADAVPVNISIGPNWNVLVITGPNTGGKTVAMKMVGLMALMHQSGLQVPAEDGSVMPVFDGVFADVGDQQSIEESVSTFSSHMKSVIEIIEGATPSSLVMFDELGSSTDPEEGSALAKAILGHLASEGVSTIATTHHRNVAEFAEANPAMLNASVQLDARTLAPTYRLTMGVPGRSYAMSIAARLGLPNDIMDDANSLMEPQHRRFEDWLTELQGQRDQLLERLEEADHNRAQTEGLRQNLESQIDYLVSHREDILDSVRRQAISEYEDVRSQLRRAEAAMSWRPTRSGAPPPPVDVAKIRRDLEAQRQNIPQAEPRRVGPRPLEVGDTVEIRGLNLKGKIVSLPDQGRDAQVNVGKVNLHVEVSRLVNVDTEDAPDDDNIRKIGIDLGPMLETTELDLRGKRAGDALLDLEEFLDKAVRDGFSSVRIIHGKGTGALRNAVREHLRRHPLARSFDSEARENGGNGATFVQLA